MSITSKQSKISKLALFFAGATLARTSGALPAAAQAGSGTQKFGWLSAEVQND